MGRFDEMSGLVEAKGSAVRSALAKSEFDWDEREKGFVVNDNPLTVERYLRRNGVKNIGVKRHAMGALVTEDEAAESALTEGRDSPLHQHAMAASTALRDLAKELQSGSIGGPPLAPYTKKLLAKAQKAVANIMKLGEDEEAPSGDVVEATSRFEKLAGLTEATPVPSPAPDAIRQALNDGLVNRFAKPLSTVYSGGARKVVLRAFASHTSVAKAWTKFVDRFVEFATININSEDADEDDESALTEAKKKKKGSLTQLKHKVWMLSADDQVGLVAAFRAKGDAHAWQMSKATSPFVKGGGSFVVEGEDGESALAEQLAELTEQADAMIEAGLLPTALDPDAPRHVHIDLALDAPRDCLDEWAAAVHDDATGDEETETEEQEEASASDADDGDADEETAEA